MNNFKKVHNYFTNKEMLIEQPDCSRYDYLLKSNEGYMNYTALTFGDRKITYEELHERIWEVARALYKKGIRKGDRIGVCLENTPEAVYVIYALGIIGATVFGLNIFNFKNPYKMMRDIELAKPKMIITTDIKNPCDALNISPIIYSPRDYENSNIPKDNSLRDIIDEGKDSEIEVAENDNTRVSDVIFTGGSTGVHKGVAHNQNGLNTVIEATKHVFKLEPGMVHLGNVPAGHMIFGRFALHYALCNNLEYALTLDSLPDGFVPEILRVKANGVMGGPVHYEALINSPLITPGSLSFLYQAKTGGEALKSATYNETIHKFRYGGSKANLDNMLGLTEMNGLTHTTFKEPYETGTIGYPIPLIEDIIVKPECLENYKPGERINLQEVEIGEAGLLLTRGESMLLGYYENKQETDKVFVYDNLGNKWYNTGDLVKRVSKDSKETRFAGRQKRNFVCGYDNIYPEQIEELLTSFPEIKSAVVTSVPDRKYQFLPVYNIILKNMNVNLEDLKNRIDNLIINTLGESALPGYVLFNTQELINGNGKLDVNTYKELSMEKYKQGELKLVRKLY